MRYQIEIVLHMLAQPVTSKVCETDGALSDASRELNQKLAQDRFTIEDESGSLITIRSQYVMAASVSRAVSPGFGGVQVLTVDGGKFRCHNTRHYHGPQGLAFPCPMCVPERMDAR